jgi:hypothetical protein
MQFTGKLNQALNPCSFIVFKVVMEIAIFESRAWPFHANLAKIMAIFEICPKEYWLYILLRGDFMTFSRSPLISMAISGHNSHEI